MSLTIKIILLTLLVSTSLMAEKVAVLSAHKSALYPNGLPSHFAVANPKAQKGGTLRLGYVGIFNTTNPYVLKGTSPWGLNPLGENLVFERLMVRAPNEPFTLYGHLAAFADVAPDNRSITFYMNPKARWADGKPITTEDVQFSFETFKAKGLANQRMLLKRVKEVKLIGSDGIQFTLNPLEDGAYDPELPLVLGMLPVIPKHFFKDREFDETTLDPLLGSGPYQIAEVSPPKKIVYERRPDYWAKDEPVSKGLYNVDRIEVTYYRDEDVARMAFGAGEYDFKIEENPTKWKTAYNFKAVKDGRMKLVELENNSSMGMWGYCFNTRHPLFKDVRVREAITILFPFDWINKNLYDGDFKRRDSYFQNTDLSSTYGAQAKKVSNDERVLIKKAQSLLKDAGWVSKQGKLVDASGKPFVFELLLPAKPAEKVALTFARTLQKVGITMKIKVMDAAQLEQRRLQFSFDMMLQQWLFSRSPGNEQKFYWSSEAATQPGSRNYPGIQDPVVDTLCGKVARAATRPDLIAASRALDLKLLNGFYVIPLYYNPKHFVAYWSKFELPPFDPNYSVMVSGIWVNNKRDTNVPKS